MLVTASVLVLLVAQQLSDDTKVCFLQVLKAWEFLIKILSQIEHFLGYLKDLVFAHVAYLDQFRDDSGVNEVLSLELLADLESNVDCTNGQEGWGFGAQLDIVH